MTPEETQKRKAFIESLRACADFLAAHPDVKTPVDVNLYAFVNTRKEIAQQARAATWEKIYSSDWFMLRRTFGNVQFDVAVSRNEVCHRVVKGTRVIPARPESIVEDVEWVCDEASLLAPVEVADGQG